MKTLGKTASFFLILAVLVLLNFVGSLLPGKLDWTEQKIYTLSDGSKNLLKKLEEPVTLKFYFSRSLEELPVQVKNYATRIEDTLREFQSANKGMVILQTIDPKPDTPEEQSAVDKGLQGAPLPNGDKVYFGLVAQYADQEAAIPLFTFERESYLEYDIAQLIYQVQTFKRPKLGILSSLPLFADYSNMNMRNMREMPRDSVLVSELKKRFEVQQLTESIPADLDLLAVIHPGVLSETLQYALDQFILSGKPVFLAVDPSSIIQRQNNQQPMMIGGMSFSSNLPRLFEKYGIAFNAEQVVGDSLFATKIQIGMGVPPMPLVTYMTVNKFPSDSPASGRLKAMQFYDTGSFELKAGSSLQLTPLIQTSDKSGTLSATSIMYSQPQDIAKQFISDGKVRTIAGIITGKFSTAFPEGKPKAAADKDSSNPPPAEDGQPQLLESSQSSTLILVADADFLTDPVSVRVMQIMDYIAVQPLNDNQAFVLNALEYLGGSQDLIGLRGKGTATRPFKRIEAMELEAQKAYQAQLDDLEKKISDINAELAKLQKTYKDAGSLVASPEVQNQIAKFRSEEAAMKVKRREIRKTLREDIEALKWKLQFANLGAPVLLIGIFAAYFFHDRSSRNRRQRS